MNEEILLLYYFRIFSLRFSVNSEEHKGVCAHALLKSPSYVELYIKQMVLLSHVSHCANLINCLSIVFRFIVHPSKVIVSSLKI